MNAPRSFFTASRTVRSFFVSILAGLLLAGLLAVASQAGMKPASTHSVGATLGLIAQVRASRLHLKAASGDPHTPDGRTLLGRAMLRAGALLQPRAAAPTIVPIPGGVQTYDVFNPPPAFRPEIGFGSATALNNDTTNPPVYISTLVPTNLTPVWSQDENFIIFSSNRTLAGGVQPNGRFHLWAISVNGGEAFQITDSQTDLSGKALPAGGGEFFPALSGSNNSLAFTSDAQSPGVQNLYLLQSNNQFSPFGPFSFTALLVHNNGQGQTNVPAALVNVSNPGVVIPMTIRSGDPNATTATTADPTTSSQFTGFSQVQRPTFSASEQIIVFSALATAGTTSGADPNPNHYHLYFLNTNTRGFSADSASYPGKLTEGPTDDTDPAYSPDGQFIAFASTATTVTTNTSNNQLGPIATPGNTQDPSQSQSTTQTPDASNRRSIFLLGGGGGTAGFGTVITVQNQIPGGRVTLVGADNYGPAWSNFANQNQYTNPQGRFAYLAFSRATLTTLPHSISYLQVASGVTSPNTETLAAESSSNPVVQLNTDNTGGSFEDAYPSWSPFLSIFSITYQSGSFNYGGIYNSAAPAVTNGRTVTYNNPASGVPVEAAVTVPDGGQVQNPDGTVSYTVGANYTGVQVSQVLNLDPPTLLRFNADEVVHVQAPGADPVRGTANKLAGAGGNRTVTLTVRLSDREAGIDNNSGPNGGPRVYLQIKDPSSKYQNSQNAEHKVFAKDRRYDAFTQTNHPTNDVTSGTMDRLVDTFAYGFEPGQDVQNGFYNPGNPAGAFFVDDFFPLPNKKYTYPSYTANDMVGQIPIGYIFPRGVHGGQWAVDATNNPDNTYIFIGKDGGGFNPGLVAPDKTLGAFGGDPRLFIPTGPEYECQVLNPQFATSGNANAVGGDSTPLNSRFDSTASNPGTTVGDYVTPFWLAGVDDQGAFSGGTYTDNPARGDASSSGTDRPVSNYTINNTNHPAEWLQLQPVPAAQQDNQGGVLYTANFTAPVSGSDFYVDVIAYDKAAFPNLPGTNYRGALSNWRIYDNVGGFSTNQSITNNDILLVSDYALGQKFAATTFGGRNTNLNLVPKLFGTESYLSDIDVNYLPDSVYAGVPTDLKNWIFNPVIVPFYGGFFRVGSQNTTVNVSFPAATPENGLGVRSYIDDVINDGTATTDGQANVQSQRYSVWRILSRGPVPQGVLNSYLPNKVAQPAVVDPLAASAYQKVAAKTVLDAHRCVIWLSPYTGDVLEDPGALDDPGTVKGVGRNSTQKNLTAFVQAGGRLCITGQDVGSTLTQGGALGNAPSGKPAAPNFLPDVLNATLVSTGTNVHVLAGSQNRIAGNPQFDQAYGGNYPKVSGAFAPGGGQPFGNLFVIMFGGGYYPFTHDIVIGDPDFADGSFSQIPPIILPTNASVQGQPDTISALNGAVTALTYGTGGPGALVYHDDPYGIPATGATAGALPNGGTGSRVVYAGFGLEALTNDYVSSASPNPDTDPMHGPAYALRVPPVTPNNTRTAILHNIVDFLRTGQVTGTITQTSGTGQGGGLGIDGVTVYLVSTTGAAPSTRVTFSALTANGGRFTILGVEPGTYFLSAVKPGFQRAPANTNTAFSVEGDVTVSGKTLTLTPLPNGSVAGLVKDTNGKPISGATVTLTSQDNSITQSITTPSTIPATVNPADNYYFQSVPVTAYTATAIGPTNPQGLPEYGSATGAPSVSPDAPNNAGFNVPSTPTVDGVNFTLTPILAKISGRIYDNTSTDDPTGGALAAGATVTLTDSTGAAVPGVAPVIAGADGTYTFTNVPAAQTPTTYTITATKGGYLTTGNTTTATVYYGSQITGADIGLTPIPPAQIHTTVSGTITDSQSKAPISGATVTLTDVNGNVVGTFTTAADGTYTFTNIQASKTASNYTVSASATGYTPGQLTVSLAYGDQLTGQNIALSEIATFYGLVKDGSGNPLPGVSITLLDPNGSIVATSPATLTTTSGTTAGPDGKPENFLATVQPTTALPGTYTLVVAKASYDSPKTPITFTLTNLTPTRVPDITLTSSIGTLGGLVADANTGAAVGGATITVTNTTTKAVVATLTTNSSATTGPDGSPLNYSGQVSEGSYTVTLTDGNRTPVSQTITIVGGQFNRLNFTGASGVAPLFTFPGGQLYFLSLPYDYSSVGFDTLFGTLNTAPTGTPPNGNRSHAAVWNPLTSAYALDPTPPADTLRLGVGYWIFLKSTVNITQQGAAPTTPYVPVTLHPAWNQIGVPSTTAIPVSSLMFENGAGGKISFATAASAQYHVVSPTLYSYDGSSYQPVTSSGSLQPTKAYWIKVFTDATIEIPTGVTTGAAVAK